MSETCETCGCAIIPPGRCVNGCGPVEGPIANLLRAQREGKAPLPPAPDVQGARERSHTLLFGPEWGDIGDCKRVHPGAPNVPSEQCDRISAELARLDAAITRKEHEAAALFEMHGRAVSARDLARKQLSEAVGLLRECSGPARHVRAGLGVRIVAYLAFLAEAGKGEP